MHGIYTASRSSNVLTPCSIKVQNFKKEDMGLCLITEEYRVASLLSYFKKDVQTTCSLLISKGLQFVFTI